MSRNGLGWRGALGVAGGLGLIGLAWLGLGIGLRAQAGSPCERPEPGWLYCEDFEGGGDGWRDWFAGSGFTECDGCVDGDENPHRIRLTQDGAFSGDWALHMPGAAEAGYRGGALTWRSCAGEKRAGCRLEGYERLHFRVRVKLAEEHAYVHHFLSLSGTRPDRYWDGDGNAGCRPNGTRWAGTTLDFDRDRELFFYTYFPEMSCARGGWCDAARAAPICELCATKEMPCSNGPECCYGNHFGPEEPVVLPRGRWVCLELMMQLNTPGMEDGEMAFWLDGVEAYRKTGMRWRDIDSLQLNKAWLKHYIAGGDADQPNEVWFDDMIVSESYIGCGPIPSPEPPTPPGPGLLLPSLHNP